MKFNPQDDRPPNVKLLQEAVMKLRMYPPPRLAPDQFSVLIHVLDELVHGYDPRPFLGIAGMAGRRNKNQARDLMLSCHYWLLREAGDSAKSTENAILYHWKVTPRMTKKIATKHRDAALFIMVRDVKIYERFAKEWVAAEA